jgi:hypothetical protein
MKTYKSRDSATSLLRKFGYNKEDYTKMIVKNSDGSFQFNCIPVDQTPKPKAKTTLADVAKKPKDQKAKAPAKKAVREDVSKVSISSVVRQGVKDGLDNSQIYQLCLKKISGFGEDKKWYVGWYRNHFKRQAAKV